MIENIKARALAGQTSIGLVVRLWDSVVLEMAKAAGYHFVRIDGEHVAYDGKTLREFFAKARHLGLAAQIRVGELWDAEPLLAMEPAAICIPGMESVEQAQEAVDKIKFAPYGKRSMYGGIPSVRYGDISRSAYEAEGNDRTQLIVQLESVKALDNIDSILSVKGIDMIASGRADIASSMGLSGQKDHPDVLAAEDMIIRKAHEYGKVLTLSVRNKARMEELKAKGVYAFSIGCDEELCFNAIRRQAQEMNA